MFCVKFLENAPSGGALVVAPAALQLCYAFQQLRVSQADSCGLDLGAEEVPGFGSVAHGGAVAPVLCLLIVLHHRQWSAARPAAPATISNKETAGAVQQVARPNRRKEAVRIGKLSRSTRPLLHTTGQSATASRGRRASRNGYLVVVVLVYYSSAVPFRFWSISTRSTGAAAATASGLTS